MAINRGDAILVPFPFTDLSSTKVRPALIISPDPQRNDLLIAFISSVISPSPDKMDFLLTADHPDFASTGLKKDSVLKMNKLLTISSTLVLRRLGCIPPVIQEELDKRLLEAVGLATLYKISKEG